MPQFHRWALNRQQKLKEFAPEPPQRGVFTHRIDLWNNPRWLNSAPFSWWDSVAKQLHAALRRFLFMKMSPTQIWDYRDVNSEDRWKELKEAREESRGPPRGNFFSFNPFYDVCSWKKHMLVPVFKYSVKKKIGVWKWKLVYLAV